MSYHPERIGGAGAIAAATRPTRPRALGGDLRSTLPAYKRARNLATAIQQANVMTTGPYGTNVTPVTSPVVAPPPTMSPPPPKPPAPGGMRPYDPAANRPPAPTPSSPAPSTPTPGPRTPTPIVVTVSPSSSTSSGGRGEGGRGGSVTVTMPSAQPSWPTSVPQSTSTKKVPWLAIGLVALAAAVLWKK